MLRFIYTYRKFVSLLTLLCCYSFSFAQTFTAEEYEANRDELLKNGTIAYVTVLNGDTMPFMHLPSLNVSSPRIFKSKKERRRYRNLERKVRKVYPYAYEAGIRLAVYDDTLSKMKSEIARKAYTKKAEKEIKKEFTKDLTQLTMSEGRILVRLIDRETGRSSYNVLRELRGAFSATFWQTFAKMWGNDLKARYDPSQGMDKYIEEIINNIENGVYD